MKCIRNLLLSLFLFLLVLPIHSQTESRQATIDKKVEAFLNSNKYSWRDMNVPATDGQILHDIIVENNYTQALEIGTSTGHSAIWIAWALSKTGGKLITIEIYEPRYREALANFKEAGLEDYIDARLANAHELVPELKGPFDFVFSDADKDWYKNYFIAVYPKLKPGGCFTAHNVTMRSHGIDQFLDHLETLEDMETTINRSSRSGISISYKHKE